MSDAGFVNNGRSVPNFRWKDLSLQQIIHSYNQVLAQYYHYYYFVDNRVNFFSTLYYLLRGSCAMLIAAKLSLHSQGKVYEKFGRYLTVADGVQLLKYS